MKTLFWILLLSAGLPMWCGAQKEGNFWMFGYCNSLNFNSGSPVHGGIPGTGYTGSFFVNFNRANVIADVNGKLLFFVKLDGNDNRRPHNANVYDANGNPMANSELVTATPVQGPVQIIKKPGADHLYYVVYSVNDALLSTTVDMRLNNGLGGIVGAEKNTLLSNWKTVVGEKTAVVQGCDGIWLVVRSRTANQYHSYKVTAAGISRQPVISECGLLPLEDYNIGAPRANGQTPMQVIGTSGLLKVAPDGEKIVACCNGGLELYRFSKCSGKLSAPVLLDTLKRYDVIHNYVLCRYNTNPALYDVPVSYYSACFSPDNTKLYATYFYSRQVYQFDLSVPNPRDIIKTKTSVLSNQPTIISCSIPLICGFVDTTGMGDLKLGPDGRIYIGNNVHPSCSSDTTYAQNHALHAILNPNIAGPGCQARLNQVILGPVDSSAYKTGQNFNPDIVLAPGRPDTLSAHHRLDLCRGSVLQTKADGDCYRWSTGVRDTAAISINAPGIYAVTYYRNCTYHIDSFWVTIPPFPKVNPLQYGCKEVLRVTATQRPGDTCFYRYSLQDEDRVYATGAGTVGFISPPLDAGAYQLHITSSGGCDTAFPVRLVQYPSPVLTTQPSDTTILYGEEVQLGVQGGISYAWAPTGSLHSPHDPDPIARPKGNTLYRVIGSNDYGCKDTGYVMVRINYEIPDRVPNAFSPNGDGLNDVFRIEGVTYQQLNFFKVFNRFGQMVFFTTDISKGWDGRYKEQPCDAGTYYYQAEWVYPDGKLKRMKGDVLLLR